MSDTDQSANSTVEDLSVSNRNLRPFISFCQRRGISPETLLADLGYSLDYLRREEHWIPLSVFIEVTERVRNLFGGDPAVLEQAGLMAIDEGLGVLEVLKRVFAVAFAGPAFLMRKVPEYNRFFNRTKFIEVIDLTSTSVTYRVKFFPAYDPTWDFNSGPYLKGFLAGLPKIWGLPPAEVKECLVEYDPVRLLREQFKLLAELRDDRLLIENEEYGQVVSLIEKEHNGHHICLGANRKGHEAPTGILITKTLYLKSYPLLVTGQIWRAPYFVITFRWKNLPVWRRLFHALALPFARKQLYLTDLEQQLQYFQEYVKQLERFVEQRSHELLEEKHEVERWKQAATGIIGSQLPTAVSKSMIRGRLMPRKNNGIILFADLVNFTERLQTTPNFLEVVADLRRFFEAANLLVKGNGGWLYKYLGDGIMAVFGGYQRNENYADLGLQALRATVKLRAMVETTGWQLRVGLEFGEFISGEVGPREERVWDFLGNPVNLAARLQHQAQPNDILIGPNLVQLLKGTINITPRSLELKGLGVITVYRFDQFV